MSKLLIGVNLTHKDFNMRRKVFTTGEAYHGHESVIRNYRTLIQSLGYDCSLLLDNEILALDNHIYEYENNPQESMLLDVLDFLVKHNPPT